MRQHSTAIAILLGFMMVAMAIMVTGNNPVAPAANNNAVANNQPSAVQPDASLTRESERHVYGNEDADIVIVEFSDFECPFCARLHPTLKQIVDESDGDIAWEYRHLPLPSHRNAETAAVASECVAKHQGNEAYWSYMDAIFANYRSISETFLNNAAAELGVSQEKMAACADDAELKSLVSTDRDTARAYGGSGTPFSVVQFADGTTRPVSGALPYESWKDLLSL